MSLALPVKCNISIFPADVPPPPPQFVGRNLSHDDVAPSSLKLYPYHPYNPYHKVGETCFLHPSSHSIGSLGDGHALPAQSGRELSLTTMPHVRPDLVRRGLTGHGGAHTHTSKKKYD